jgi:hypothetical protein
MTEKIGRKLREIYNIGASIWTGGDWVPVSGNYKRISLFKWKK